MNLIQHPRRSVVGLSIGVNSVLCVVAGALGSVPGGGSWIEGAWLGLIVAGVLSVYLVAKTRRRSLTVSDTGLTAQRDSYRVSCSWDDVASVSRRRLGGMLPVDVIVFQRGRTEPVDSRGRPRKGVSRKVAKIGADRQIQIGVYDAAWRDGPVGEILAARGVPIGRA